MPVSHPIKSDVNTSPDPELNPLLNPLLAAHMGRWAEVYFTNPPEKREEAVSELLRELENVSPSKPASVEDSSAEPAKKNAETVDSPNSSSLLQPGHTCRECAHHNSPDHEFCGMCGAPLQILAPAASFGQSWCERTLGSPPIAEPIQAAAEDVIESAVSSSAAAARREATEPSEFLPELRPTLQSELRPQLRPELRPQFRPKLVPNPLPREYPLRSLESLPRLDRFYLYRYRFHLGAVLAILLVVGFIVWGSRDAHSGASRSPAVSAIPQAQPAPLDSAQPPGATSSASPAIQRASPIASAAQNQNQANAITPRDHAADSRTTSQNTAPQNVAVVATPSAVVAPAQSGAEELAMAEKYLNPARGTTGDSGEAVEWLWKAVRKRNLDATLALSDLYVRGDGVPKSCDQARLLLEAAAKKGSKAAGERLRNLQAFGCQ
jgi:hypothetical protein